MICIDFPFHGNDKGFQIYKLKLIKKEHHLNYRHHQTPH